MSDFEPLIVLDDREATHKVTLFRDHLVGMHALIHWLEGFEKSGQGRVPGKFELVMHYRSLRRAVEPEPQKENKDGER